MATVARVRFTKKVIRDAFLSLLREKSVKQITVTELCRQAEINRATFYKHYRDAYDLLEQIETEALDHLRETSQQVQDVNSMDHFVRLLERAREHHQEFAVVASQNGDPFFSRRISACLYDSIRSAVFRHLPELPEDKKAMVCCFLERGGSGVLEHWMETGMRREPEAVARLVFDLSSAAIRLRSI